MSNLLRTLAVACMILTSTTGIAQTAGFLRAVNLRTGPDVVFPVVTRLDSDDMAQVQGCLADFTWCDVVAGRQRGWVSAKYLRNVFRNRTAVITFSVEEYWDAHYRNRNWYADKAAWVGWGTPGWTPPPPPRPRWRGVRDETLR